jgi:hypothetical protein
MTMHKFFLFHILEKKTIPMVQCLRFRKHIYQVIHHAVFLGLGMHTEKMDTVQSNGKIIH